MLTRNEAIEAAVRLLLGEVERVLGPDYLYGPLLAWQQFRALDAALALPKREPELGGCVACTAGTCGAHPNQDHGRRAPEPDAVAITHGIERASIQISDEYARTLGVPPGRYVLYAEAKQEGGE